MLPSLGSKSEEDEENKRANDAGPLGEGYTDHYEVIASPDDCRNLPNTAKIIVGVFPTNPRRDRGCGGVDDHRENRQRSGAQNFRASQSHQTKISAGSEG